MDALVNTIVIESHNGVLVDHISGWNIEDNPMIDDVQVVILMVLPKGKEREINPPPPPGQREEITGKNTQ